jgi:hypothetical protein
MPTPAAAQRDRREAFMEPTGASEQLLSTPNVRGRQREGSLGCRMQSHPPAGMVEGANVVHVVIAEIGDVSRVPVQSGSCRPTSSRRHLVMVPSLLHVNGSIRHSVPLRG